MPEVYDMEIDDYTAACLVLEDLDNAFKRLPSDTYYWGVRQAEADAEVLRAKHTLKRTEAAQLLQMRSRMAGQKVNKDILEAMVHSSQEYEDAQLAVIEAEAKKGSVRARSAALHDKRAALITLGNLRREEMRSNLSPLRDDEPTALEADPQVQGALR